MDELEQPATEQWWARQVDDGQWVIMVAHRERVAGQRWTAYRETTLSEPMSASAALAVLRYATAVTQPA